MIAEIGLGLLWLAAGLAVLQAVLGGLSLRLSHRPDLGDAVRPVAVAQGVLGALSFGVLVYLFMVSDMSVKLVAANSHSEKPWLYKFAGSWGNHEGSMLLWVAILALAGSGIALIERRVRRGGLHLPARVDRPRVRHHGPAARAPHARILAAGRRVLGRLHCVRRGRVAHAAGVH